MVFQIKSKSLQTRFSGSGKHFKLLQKWPILSSVELQLRDWNILDDGRPWWIPSGDSLDKTSGVQDPSAGENVNLGLGGETNVQRQSLSWLDRAQITELEHFLSFSLSSAKWQLGWCRFKISEWDVTPPTQVMQMFILQLCEYSLEIF